LQKPKYAKFSGYLNNKLGEIVTWLAAKEDNTKYTYTAWDIFEAYVYINASPRLNIMFSGGDIKSAIKTVLQSDMAYLIQKNDGRLTLRKWGGSYFVHEIDAFRIMDYPEKDFSDAEKNYFSSCRIKAGYNYLTKEYDENYLYTERESYAVNKFLKTRVAEYETRLISREDEEGLARSLSERFLDIKETVRVSVMRDLSGFKLLDMVKFKPGLEVNDRKYSDVETWIIKEIDYANDKLVLEAL
jgi:ribosomal protein S17E